jgi:hypothetical protein
MVVKKVVYLTDFLMFTALLDCLTYGTVDNNKTTVCTDVRCVQIYGTYKCTICTDVLYVQMYDV